MAFALEKNLDGTPLNDPNYVKFMAAHWKLVDGKKILTEVPMRICTEADYSKFWPPRSANQARVDKFK